MFFALQKTKMRTFCFAEHFPKENVQLCKNAFLHQMHFCTAFVFCKAKNTAFCRFLTFCKQNVRVASNAFLHQQNVMLNIFQRKMFSIRKTRFIRKILVKQFVNQNQIFNNNKFDIKTKNYGTWKI